MFHRKKLNIFEIALIFINALVIIIGYSFIHGLVAKEGLSWQALQSIFLWLVLIMLIIVAAVAENMKEELKILIVNHFKEMKLLREDLRRR